MKKRKLLFTMLALSLGCLSGGSGLTILGTVYLYLPAGVNITCVGANASVNIRLSLQQGKGGLIVFCL